MARTHTTRCIDCGGEMIMRFRPPAGGISCGTGPCGKAHNARVSAAQREASGRAAATRRARAAAPRRTGMVGDGSWSFIAAINGLTPDGSRRDRTR